MMFAYCHSSEGYQINRSKAVLIAGISRFMAETVLKLEMTGVVDEQRLAKAVDKFTRWRGTAALPCAADNDAPDIMIKTTWGHTSVRKTLIFQEAGWAEKFLSIWQTEQKLQA